MRPIPQEEYQPVLLNILIAFQAYCQKNDIDLLLCGGSALGAVRHKGFIPWDDDIDTIIFRDDFEKLTQLAEKDPFVDEQRRYKILVPGRFPSVYPFFKVIDTKTIVYEKNLAKKYAIGAWIDVFCFSYWSDDIKIAQKQFKRQQFYKTMNKLIIGGNYRIKKYKYMELLSAPVRTVMLVLGLNSEYWCKKMIALDKFRAGEYMGNICWPESFSKEHYRADWFRESIEVSFEGIICRIPKNYHEILSNFYGDYMTMPPEEKRVRHNPDAFYIE